MSKLILEWKKCIPNESNNDNHWCNLVNLEKKDLNYNGVYIIWYPKGPVLKIGSGNIRERLEKHSNKNEDFYKGLMKYNKKNNTNFNLEDLLVTFAQVNGNQMEGVEAYLANIYKNVLDSETTAIRFPNKKMIEVNNPFDK
ncbi:hypothetical protein [uncultured Brachyspira sp.]|uniref:hypothetical protein n=1 Tax=uncultured Brachyspira sp. TaxID=221953 RepID=UPI00261DF8D2|nr:hypothetical protein [uncultured Brachyspira sp.]